MRPDTSAPARRRLAGQADIHAALLTCGCALICFQQLQRRFW
ncbi:MAG: hypothetical protein JWR69_271 [Pedosphaera sp.]|nr:hypothetical protein [Pedosphaera sp.]